MFTGLGCLKDFVAEWDSLLEQSANTRVVQEQSISGIATMQIRAGVWEIDMGE